MSSLAKNNTYSAVTLMPFLAISSSPMLDIITIKTRSFVPSDRVNGNLRSLSYGSQLCSCLSLPYGRHHYHKAKATLRAARPNRRDRGAKIHFKGVHFGVFSTSRFAPLALTSDWTFSKVVPTDPLGVVMLFAVSQGSQPTFGNLRKRSFFITHFFVTETGSQLEMGNSFFMSNSI